MSVTVYRRSGCVVRPIAVEYNGHGWNLEEDEARELAQQLNALLGTADDIGATYWRERHEILWKRFDAKAAECEALRDRVAEMQQRIDKAEAAHPNNPNQFGYGCVCNGLAKQLNDSETLAAQNAKLRKRVTELQELLDKTTALGKAVQDRLDKMTEEARCLHCDVEKPYTPACLKRDQLLRDLAARNGKMQRNMRAAVELLKEG